MDWVAGVFDAAQQWVFENTIQPLLFMLGWGGILSPAMRRLGGCWWACSDRGDLSGYWASAKVETSGAM